MTEISFEIILQQGKNDYVIMPETVYTINAFWYDVLRSFLFCWLYKLFKVALFIAQSNVFFYFASLNAHFDFSSFCQFFIDLLPTSFSCEPLIIVSRKFYMSECQVKESWFFAPPKNEKFHLFEDKN